MRWTIGLALGFYFRRIERFHGERVPLKGPVLLTCNHPNSLTDSFVVGAAVPRKVNFVATVELFRFAPLRWLLTSCGVIPINRLKDDPKAMRSVADTFEACYRVLERGEAIGIFPEGITHDDPQLKTVKTGAARMALDLEHRHEGKLGLQIIPVGLNLSAKERYRSDVLVSFGEPIRASGFLPGYPERKKECIASLNSRIEESIQVLILHLPHLEQARVVDAVKRLYLDRLWVADRMVSEAKAKATEELHLTRMIAVAVERIYETQPERASAFVRALDRYEALLRRLKLSDESLARASGKRSLARLGLGWTALALFGAPIALYGWVHRLLPFVVVRWAVNRFANVRLHKAQTSTAAIIAGVVSFTFFYCVYLLIFHHLFGWPASMWYGLSLPVAGLIANYYLSRLRELTGRVRKTFVLLRAPAAARRLIRMRTQLIAEIETARAQVQMPAESGAQR
jgi:glycerol-3-phosphate O-acyltransferase/dihydroxyacetone phosphate acyltransferase